MQRFYYITDCRSQMAFMGLDFEVDKPRINVELRELMAEL